MVRETRHLWVGNLPENVSKERIKEYFNRYGPVQSVKYLPCKDGDVVSAVQVAFMDIKSAKKALQTTHHLEERPLKTDFYDPTSGDCGTGSCPPTPEEKGGGPGGGAVKLEHSRTSQHYYRGHGDRTDYGARTHPSSRYPETSDFRHRPRPPYRSNSSFSQDSVRSGSSSYRNNYWKDSRPRQDQTSYNSGEKSEPPQPSQPSRLVNNKPVNGGGPVTLGQSSLPQHKKKQRTRRSRSNSSSDSQQSGSNSRSSSSSSSRSSSSGSGSSKSPSPSRSRLGKGVGLGHCLPHTEFDKHCTIYVRNLPDKPTEHALKEELARDYQKGGCAVRSVRIVEKRSQTGAGRNAIITFRDPADVSKALEDSRNKRIFGSLIDVEKFSAHQAQDDRPRDGELSEFHPKATRTLFVGNISREVRDIHIHQRFKEFGEILLIDIKKPDYALVQFFDIKSVIKAIKAADGELIGGQRVCLKFGLSVATKCVWLDGVAAEVSENSLQKEFSQFGRIQNLIIDRSRGHALVYFDQLKKATIAVSEVRGRSIHGSKLMTDYASYECRTAFFEHCKKSGMDIRERSKTWEQESDSADRRSERIHRDRSNESRGSGTSRTGGRKRDEYDEELRRFQSDRGKIETETERCFTPPYASSRRGLVSGPSRSPSPPRGVAGPSPSNSRSDRDRAFSDRDSVVSDGSRHGSPVSRDSWRSRYKPRTQAISPPGDSRSPAEPDSDRRGKRYRLDNGESGDYRGRSRSAVAGVPPQDPRIEAEPGEKKSSSEYKMLGVDSGLSEDTSSGSSGSVPDVDNAKLPGRSQHVRRSSSDSAVSRDESSRPATPSISHIPVVYTSNTNSLLRVVPALADCEAGIGYGVPKTPVSPPGSSEGSRPGTPLCDENPENLMSRSVAGPVRLPASSHLRHQHSSEPMSLPLPRFAQHVLSTSPGERSQRSQQISPREPRTETSGQTVNTLKQARPELSKLKIVSPTKAGQPGSADTRSRDPRLKSPSLKSPGIQPPLKSPTATQVPAGPVQSLTVKVAPGDCKPKDPRLGTGLLTVATGVPSAATSSPASPSPTQRLARPRTPPLHIETEPVPALSAESSDPSTMDIDERIKLLKERFDAWDGHTRHIAGPARQDQASRFNLDRRPSQPSAIVQQLLSRKSVFDEDSRRLERTNEPSESDGGGRTPSTPSTPSTPGLSQNTTSTSTSNSTTTNSSTTAPVRETSVKPESASASPSSEKSCALAPLSESVQTTLPRELPSLPPLAVSLSPARASAVRQNSALSPSPASRQFFPSPVQTPKVPEDPTRPLPLPSKAGTSVSAVTFPIKPLVDKLSKPAAFTKPSATVTPTLKSTGLTASSVKPTVFTTTSTKTVSTSTMVPSAQHQVKGVEKGEASSTTCSPKPDSALSELATVTSNLSSQDTDSDPNVTSTTGIESKKKVDKDIKTIKKEFDSLTSFKEKKEMREELFAPTATIIQQVKPKYDKMEKKPNSSSKFDLFDVKKAKDKLHKDKLLSSKEKKDKLKVKQKNDLKGFLTAEAPIRKINEKKSESLSLKKEEKTDIKRRLSVTSELDDLEPKAKVAKLKSESDCESEAKKLKIEPMKPMGRIPKLEKKEEKRERTDSVRSLDSTTDKEKDKDKHKSHSKSKSKHEDRHRHKSSDRTEDRGKDKHKKKKKEKDKDRDRDKEVKPKVDASKSRSISTDDDKHHKKPKKSKDSKHRDKKDFKMESKDRIRDKDKKDKHREKDKEKEKERKRKKEDDERRKAEHMRKKKKLDDSSNSDNSDDSSDGEDRKFSIFEEPVFDENNPVYFSMYDKVKARRSCVKAKEEEEQKRQEEALKKFAKLKAQRAKREGKKKSVDSDDSLSDEDMPSFEEMKEDLKSKKKPSLIDSSSDSDEEGNSLKKKKSKSLGSPGENRKRSFKPKRTVMDSSDDDSDEETQKPTSKTLSKQIGLDSSDSDDIMESPEVSMKKHSFLESDSEREIKTKIKTESDFGDNDQSKLKSKSVTESDSEVEQKSLALLAKSKHKSKDKSSVKVEPLSTDSEEEKVDVSKFNIKREIKKEIKSEKSSVKESKGFDGKSKGISSKKKSKDESQKEKSLLGQKLKRANLFGTSSEDESTSRTTKPPTPVTTSSSGSGKLSSEQTAKPVKLNIEQIYSDSEPDKRNDSPAIESDSSDGIPSRPPTPSFPSVKIEESKPKATSDEVEEIPVKTCSSKEEKNTAVASDKMFDSLLTINVDCQSKQPSKKSPSNLSKSPGSLKSPGKNGGSSGTTLSPGSHRSPLISPGGKPTYLLAHMHDKLASMEAEKIHRAQEKESKKRVPDKPSKDSFKTKKDVADSSKKVEIKQTKSVTEKHDQDVKMEVQNKDDANKETLCLSETDSDSNEITFKKENQTETTTTVEELKTKTEEQRKTKSSSKLSSRQASDESTDENGSLVIDLDSKKEKEKSVFDFNDDSEEGFESKPSLESGRKPLREAFKISPKSSATSYASFAAGTQSEASSSPSAVTEFKNVVILSDESPTSNDSSRKSPTDDLVILEKESSGEEELPVLTKEQQLENSIASITGQTKPDVLSESGGNFPQSAAETERKRTVISQEETESAVNALLGESFDSFDADAVAGNQVENMDEDPVNTLADDEAAAAVAGLACLSEMSAGTEDWARNEKVQAERSRADEKQDDESIENIAAEIRRSSTEEKSSPDSSKPAVKTESVAVVKQETVKKEEVKPVEKDPKLLKNREVEQAALRSQKIFEFTESEEKDVKIEEKTKVVLANSEVSEAAAAPPLESKHQTRVIPVGVAPVKVLTGTQLSPTKVSSPAPAPAPSTIVIPTTASGPVSREPTQTNPASPLQPLRLSIDETLSPSLTISSPSSRSPRPRMRRSTGGNSRESEEESAVTKQKINLILQHAKQEAERAAQHQPVTLPSYRVTDSGLPINLISQPNSGNQSQELLIDPKTGQAVRLASPASSVTLTLVTSGVARAGIPQPTVLPPRHDQQVRPPTVRPPLAPGPRQPLPIQLPTQPLPPESVRKTQPVLLEQNSAAKVGPVGPVSASLPRSVSLPTEPVPMSVANKMPSLPRTPLPLTSGQLVTTRQMPQTVSSSARQVVTSTATRPSPAVTASRAQHLAQEGQRVSLPKRDEEMDLKQKEQQEPLALASQIKAQRDFLQPRDREPVHRPSSTPLTSLTSKEEEKSQQPPAAHHFSVPSSHPQLLDSPEYRAMELWRLRIDLTQQLVAAGTPEHLVQSYVEKLLSERMMMEMMSRAANSQPVHEEPRPGSVPPNMMRHLEELRLQQSRQPLPAHSDPYRSESPMFSPHVVGHPYPDQYRPDMVPPAAHAVQPIRLTQSPGVSDFSTRSRPPSPAYTPTTDYTLPHLAAYPICWTGTLGLKNEMANVRMHYVAGNRDLAMASLPTRGSTLKIMQRMRLEDSQLEGVARKMETAGEHCMLLALPNGSEHEEIELQSRNLRHSFITYLQLKAAAGIVNVSNEDNQPAYIVHVFPSCDFANVNLARIAPNLLHRVADIEHLVIVIATVFDNR